MNTQTLSGVGFASSLHSPHGIDAVILLGASCGGEAEYAMIAEELGYGPLVMPDPCDMQTIRRQLDSIGLLQPPVAYDHALAPLSGCESSPVGTGGRNPVPVTLG